MTEKTPNGRLCTLQAQADAIAYLKQRLRDIRNETIEECAKVLEAKDAEIAALKAALFQISQFRGQIIEECAKLAEAQPPYWDIPAAIRALKEAPHE